ncbi:MAG: hypothetical protein KJ927_18925 [Candidatus Eisenbacteria bacterium]|nr:hypothetical protein [Candidatus Eisenbacteria bacterium]
MRGAYRKSLEYDTFINHESRRFLSQHVLNGEDLLPVDYIVDEMEKNVQEHPLDAKSYIYLGLLYSKNARDKDKAKWAVREARRLAPFRPEVRDMEELCKP